MNIYEIIGRICVYGGFTITAAIAVIRLLCGKKKEDISTKTTSVKYEAKYKEAPSEWH